jgi:hypothetical protein
MDIDSMLNSTHPELLKKRQLVNNYQTIHPGTVIREASLADPLVQNVLKDIDCTWRATRNDNENSTSSWEQRAFVHCLKNHQDFDLTVLLAEREDGSHPGFTLNENLGNAYCTFHFGKTLPGYTGLLDSLITETAKLMLSKGCRWMNFQEDHGNPGLRRMKRSWNPCRMLRVYDVRTRG